MSTNIEELLKQNKRNSSRDGEDNSDKDRGRLELATEEKQGQLRSKMDELKRRDKELETLNNSRALSVGYLSLQGVSIDPAVLQLISEHEAQNKKAICFYYVPYQEMRVGVLDPGSVGAEELKKRLGEQHHTPVKIYLLSQESFEEGLDQYKKLPHIRAVVKKIDITPQDLKKFVDLKTLEDLPRMIKHVNTSELLTLVVAAAIQLNASDIHIESKEHALALRYRIDGILQDAATLEMSLYQPITSRVKLLSKLKINITQRPQDGHFVIEMPEGKIDVRVSTLPTNYGESIVMRVLRSDITRLKISDLGLSEYNFAILDKEIKKPNGMLVVTGPTGSGKTTSLYAILGELNTKDVKILTIEDPIEYEVAGVNQSQVNPDANYTFAAGLRSLVRQDPDVILVGEMRDEETVEIAINASLTGHMVLSTLHTNDAAGTIPRFLSMEAKPYLLAPALNTVIAQRLVRKLCEACKEIKELDHEVKQQVDEMLKAVPEGAKQSLSTESEFYTSKGCEECFGFGYKGRVGIFEIFIMTSKLEESVLKGEMSSVAFRQLLAEQGMITMAQDGLLKALQGITSVEEVFRVAQKE